MLFKIYQQLLFPACLISSQQERSFLLGFSCIFLPINPRRRVLNSPPFLPPSQVSRNSPFFSSSFSGVLLFLPSAERKGRGLQLMQLRVSQVEGITYKYRLYIRFSSVLNAYYVSFLININIYKHETQFITMLYSYFNYFTIQNSASELFFRKPWPYFVTDFSQPLKARMLKLRCRGSSLGISSL